MIRVVPTVEALEYFNSASDFVALSSDDNANSTFRNFFLLPPCMVAAFLSMPSREHNDLACVAKSASENFKINHIGNKDFTEEEHYKALVHVLEFLWCCEKKILDPQFVGVASNESLSG